MRRCLLATLVLLGACGPSAEATPPAMPTSGGGSAPTAPAPVPAPAGAAAPGASAAPAPAEPAGGGARAAGAPGCGPSSPWKRVDVGEFSFEVPCDLQAVPVQGIDSKVGRHESATIALMFDYGRYSSPLDELKGAPSHRAESATIDAKSAKIVTASPGDDPKLPLVAAVYFPDVTPSGGTKLTVFVRCASPAEQQAAKKIFHSIRFARR